MNNISDENNKIFWLAPIVVLAIGILPLPIGYYTLSRLVVCASAIYFAYNFNKKNNQTNLWIFGFIAVLYNPIIPVYLYEKIIWVVVNIITIYLFYKNKDLN
jgi:hypothetical protein